MIEHCYEAFPNFSEIFLIAIKTQQNELIIVNYNVILNVEYEQNELIIVNYNVILNVEYFLWMQIDLKSRY